MKRSRGFTIVEMLVVVTIILVMVTASISVLNVFMRGQSIKQAGRIINSQFMQARQKSTSEKVVYFLVFDSVKMSMTLYRDTDLDKILTLGTDEKIGDEVPLIKSIDFDTSSNQSLFGGPAPVYIRFYPDGSCILPGAYKPYDPDITNTACIILSQQGQTQRVYLDISTSTGKLRKQAYRN